MANKIAYSSNAPLIIDLNQFKLHLNIQEIRELSLHFDTEKNRKKGARSIVVPIGSDEKLNFIYLFFLAFFISFQIPFKHSSVRSFEN